MGTRIVESVCGSIEFNPWRLCMLMDGGLDLIIVRNVQQPTRCRRRTRSNVSLDAWDIDGQAEITLELAHQYLVDLRPMTSQVAHISSESSYSMSPSQP